MPPGRCGVPPRARVVGRLGILADHPGTSAGSSSPWRRQPTLSNQVRARATAGRSSAAGRVTSSVSGTPRFHPSNHRAEDAGSSRTARASAAAPSPRAGARSAARSEARVVLPSASAGDARGSDRPPRARSGRPTRFTARASRAPIAIMPRPSGVAVVRLDDEMGMVALQRVVHEPKVRTRAAGGEGPLDLAHDAEGAERREIGPEAQRDVGGQHPEGLAGDVREPGPRAGGLPPGVLPRPPHPGVLAMGERVGELGEPWVRPS